MLGFLVDTAEADEGIGSDGRIGEGEPGDAAVGLEMSAVGDAADGLGAERRVLVFEADSGDLVEVINAGAAEGEVVLAGHAVDVGVAQSGGDFARAGGDALGEGGRG